MDGTSLCTWSQFIHWPFAVHITTQRPPKFFKDIQSVLLDNNVFSSLPTPDVDQNTGLPIFQPTADLVKQSYSSVRHKHPDELDTLLLKPYFRLASNPLYFPSAIKTSLSAIPSQGYFWILIPHPTSNQISIGRVYTRDPVNKVLYVQHFQVVVDSITSYKLKQTKRNQDSKGATNYNSTTATSAIIKCQGCGLHDSSHLVEANQRAHRNFRSFPMCIFKQSDDAAWLLPIKSH